MSKPAAAVLFAALILAACGNGSPTPTAQPTSGGTVAPAASTQGAGSTDLDPNTVAAFCQAMQTTLVASWPPKDSAAAALISPLLRNWASVAGFSAIAADLLAVSDWTASMSIMNPVPTPPADVTAAWNKLVAFQSTSCA
jgi:hypothetical protein